jgi:hypothetical protein
MELHSSDENQPLWLPRAEALVAFARACFRDGKAARGWARSDLRREDYNGKPFASKALSTSSRAAPARAGTGSSPSPRAARRGSASSPRHCPGRGRARSR